MDKLQGGSFGGVDDLYREVILDHFKSPHNKGKLKNANTHSEGVNPLCGDQISVMLLIENDSIKEVKFEGHGCAISQSAASMMTDVIKGRLIKDVKELSATFKKIFGIEDPEYTTTAPLDEIGDAVALEGVRKYPVRIKCALLSWNTLLESIKNHEKKEGSL
ncbi:SUF system NifU family Fe-S cluster assembly protein [bacterium F11]|nr:SUF system NifU family Fe-S cluster assembly protein [bacterium F11]